jgi:hypothetical protein
MFCFSLKGPPDKAFIHQFSTEIELYVKCIVKEKLHLENAFFKCDKINKIKSSCLEDLWAMFTEENYQMTRNLPLWSPPSPFIVNLLCLPVSNRVFGAAHFFHQILYFASNMSTDGNSFAWSKSNNTPLPKLFLNSDKRSPENATTTLKLTSHFSTMYSTWDPLWLQRRVTRLGEFSPTGQLFSLGSYFNYRISPNIWAAFFHCNSLVLILTKYGLGYILGPVPEAGAWIRFKIWISSTLWC